MQADRLQDTPGIDDEHRRSKPALRIRFPQALVAACRSVFLARSRAGLLLSALAVLALLAGIVFVLRQSVRQGDASRNAMALQAEVDWRCGALMPRLQRERCLALAQARKPEDSAGVQALVHEARSAAVRP